MFNVSLSGHFLPRTPIFTHSNFSYTDAYLAFRAGGTGGDSVVAMR